MFYSQELLNEVQEYRALKEEFLKLNVEANAIIEEVCHTALFEWERQHDDCLSQLRSVEAELTRYEDFRVADNKLASLEDEIERNSNTLTRLESGLAELKSRKGIISNLFVGNQKAGQHKAIDALRNEIEQSKARCEADKIDLEKLLLATFGHSDRNKARIDYRELSDRKKQLEKDEDQLNIELKEEFADKNFSEEQWDKVSRCFELMFKLGFSLVYTDKNICINLIGSLLQRIDFCPDLLSVAQMSLLQRDPLGIHLELDKNFSIPCREFYDELYYSFKCNYEENYYKTICDAVDLNAHIVVYEQQFHLAIEDNCGFSIGGKRDGKKAADSGNGRGVLFIYSDEFLGYIQQYAEQNSEIKLTGLTESVRSRFGVIVSSEYLASLKEFKRLYEATPEQILIDEQRYFKKKEIEQLAENKRLDLEAYERQERLNRRQEARLAKEEAARSERQHREALSQKAQFAREATRRQEEKDRRERYEARRVREAENKKSQDMRHLCWKCANYMNGCRGGKANCGNYRAKR